MRGPSALPSRVPSLSLSLSYSIFSFRYEEIRQMNLAISQRATDCKFRRFASRQSFYRYDWPSCLVSSGECPTTVVARNCATSAIVFRTCPDTTFWKTHHAFDSQPKDRLSARLWTSLCLLVFRQFLLSRNAIHFSIHASVHYHWGIEYD